ncbi:preprotein translocase subunit SecG [Poriferisphaera corsica]|uniref:Protein-export membrane protein SecG n=1 Tax=Poriferisphaera corsica TaxID=2528020 RepID=A0A517YY97_9BACT|nr:preprotein translocase subunit SecG [Poriferisphaera corsica]QDU35179.1 preprotein translocase subunit SecG [Poriferisphaera corsica]
MMILGVNYGLIYTLMTLFVLVAAFMMLVILIQKPKGGGLSGAFGGGGGSEGAAFGAKTGDVLTKITIAAFIIFLGLAIGLNLLVNDTHDALEQELTVNQVDSEEIDDLATEAVDPQQPADVTDVPGPAEEGAAPEGAKVDSEVEAPIVPDTTAPQDNTNNQ